MTRGGAVTEEKIEVPTPKETGVAETQKPTLVGEVVQRAPLDAFPLARGLVAAMGQTNALGRVGTQLVQSYAEQMEQDRVEDRSEMRVQQRQLDAEREKNAVLRVENAKLSAQLSAERENKRLTKSLMVVGTGFIAFSLKLWSVDKASAVIAAILGGALLLIGWFKPSKEAQ